jgi:2-polyprenyl-6-methoxyphenol hydroxylase-like FAD-dependent oxidoreductase
VRSRSDILIVGGGLAGSLSALVLALRGMQVSVVDPHALYPAELRCEKLTAAHLKILNRLGLAHLIEKSGRVYDWITLAQAGRTIGRRRIREIGIAYEELVRAIRSAWPPSIELVTAHAVQARTGLERQFVSTKSGAELEGRLLLLATGPSERARRLVDMQKHVSVEGHTLTVGFSLSAAPGQAFPFESLTYQSSRGDRYAYVTFFPLGDAMRVNIFCYPDDQRHWAAMFRHDPLSGLFRIAPGVERYIGRAAVVGPIGLRGTDIYCVPDRHRDGVVLVGEASRSTCPATGAGALCVLNDVERLVDAHIPAWFLRKEMSADLLSSFYQDPVKNALDAHATRVGRNLRQMSVDDGLASNFRRAVVGLRSRVACQIDRAQSLTRTAARSAPKAD